MPSEPTAACHVKRLWSFREQLRVACGWLACGGARAAERPSRVPQTFLLLYCCTSVVSATATALPEPLESCPSPDKPRSHAARAASRGQVTLCLTSDPADGRSWPCSHGVRLTPHATPVRPAAQAEPWWWLRPRKCSSRAAGRSVAHGRGAHRATVQRPSESSFVSHEAAL